MHTHPLTLDVAPWVLFRALAHRERPFYIDAAQPWGEEWTSCMGFGPRMQFRVGVGASALAALDDIVDTIRVPRTRTRDQTVPFAGGAVFALAYEAKNEIEQLPAPRREASHAARLVGAVYDAVIVYDHRRHTYAVASHDLDAAALARYADEVRALAADAPERRADTGTPLAGPLSFPVGPARYAARVRRALAYIAAGDVYQVNLSMPVEAPLAMAPVDVYERIRSVQPVPFGAFLDGGPEQILSNSPELFLRRRGDHVLTCPIKGTRPRGRSTDEDRALARELETDAKERAEHVMIVDLERNDLGRLCRTGTIEVARMAGVSRLATLHHLVSTVRGHLRPGTATGALLRATFPSGSITGAPKIRAMEVIDELEDDVRGFYTGALGWIDATGDLDLNVAIRTAVARDGRLAYRVGSGIVADSSVEREYEECLLKAEALVRATAPVSGHAPAARAAGA